MDLTTKILIFLNKRYPPKTAFLLLTIIYLLAIYPLIRANYSYLDDVGRVAFGFRIWDNFSRYISEFFSPLLHGSLYLSDISPLPQLLAICLMALTNIIMIMVLKGKREITAFDIIAVIPAGLFPYFLSCLSFKYDAPYIALSILASVFPLLFKDRAVFQYFCVVLIGTLIMCMSYQASSGVFPMLVILLSFLMWFNGKPLRETGKFILISIISYFLGLLIFKLFIMHPLPPESSYVSVQIGSLKETISHYWTYFQNFRYDFRDIWKYLILALGIWFIIVILFKSKHHKLLFSFMAIFLLLLMFMSSFGIYPFLAKPLFMPRAMYGIGIFIAAIAVSNPAIKKAKLVTFILIAPLSWMFFTFTIAYGNILSEQEKYATFRITEILTALGKIEGFENAKTIRIEGQIGYCPIILNMPDNGHIIETLVPVYFEGKLMHYHGLEKFFKNKDIERGNYDNYNLKSESFYHKIYEKDGKFVLEMK